MAAVNVFELFATLGLNDDGFKSGLDKATSLIGGMEAVLGQFADTVQKRAVLLSKIWVYPLPIKRSNCA